MLRFVILTHDHPVLHWDFMLEKEAHLRTWRLEQAPANGLEIAAESLADHRLAYLDYQGPVSGDRGTVRRFDRGGFALMTETDELIVVELSGKLLNGKAALRRLNETGAWIFQYSSRAPA